MSQKSTKTGPKEWGESRTSQAFVKSCDINNLLKKAAREGGLSHLEKHGAHYGDFTDFDFLEAQNALAHGRQIFEELPAEIRREFQNDPGQFFEYVNHPDNVDDLPRLIPELAKPGTQRINPGTMRDPELLPTMPGESQAGGSAAADPEPQAPADDPAPTPAAPAPDET